MQQRNNGEDILYHFFQKQLMAKDPAFARSFIKQAIVALGIWIHPDFFREMPIILPFVVRDSSCRKNKETGADEWASPNSAGLLRDDNSLVKGIVKSMKIKSAKGLYKDFGIGNGFVASHIWRKVVGDDPGCLASRNPWLNTFIPNLVWLPKQISKMTDREGDFAQQYLQALSRHIYGNCSCKPGVQERVSRLWAMLPTPSGFEDEQFPSMEELNFFVPQMKLIEGRKKKLQQVINALHDAASGVPLSKKIIATRYTQGLPKVDPHVLLQLASSLQGYMNELS